MYSGDVYALMEQFKALTAKEQECFYLLGANLLYYAGLERSIESKLTDANKISGLVNKILNLEIYSVIHSISPTEESAKQLQTLAAEVEALVLSLTDTENRDTYLAPIYQDYLGN